MKAINVKKEACTHYCGRAESYDKDKHGIDMSILGNPFKVKPWGIYNRDESVAMYRKWLNANRKAETEIWLEVVALPENAVLGCFCKPLACHCDIIIKAWKWHHKVK